MTALLRSRLLQTTGAAHAFGTRDAPAPADLLRPSQVHGRVVARARGRVGEVLGDADAVVSDGSLPVGIVTADCVPILLASHDGHAVAAVHGGWRGLAAGVVEAGVEALRQLAKGAPVVAAIGPHVGPCCYEVDEPVMRALGDADPEVRAMATRPSRPGHVWLDLERVARRALLRADVERIDAEPATCTACDPGRFYSVRRDGGATGRLVHWVQATSHSPGDDS